MGKERAGKEIDLETVRDSISNETLALLNLPYCKTEQPSLFENWACENLTPKRYKTKEGLTFNEEIFSQALARGYSQINAWRIAYPNSKTANLNTIYPKASRLANTGKIKARVHDIAKYLEDHTLMSTTEYYSHLNNEIRNGGKGKAAALKIVGQIKGVLQAEKGLPGSTENPLVISVMHAPAQENKNASS